ncbi:MAG: hypothetical protein NTX49_09720 [Chlamydiae bacterium]|nr:hypothetical protein [Chlamydiota bacterium]
MTTPPTIQGMNQRHPLEAPTTGRSPPAAPPPSSTPTSAIAAHIFASPLADRRSPPVAQTRPIAPAASLADQAQALDSQVSFFSSRVMSTPKESTTIPAAALAIRLLPQPQAAFHHPLETASSAPQRQALTPASASSGHRLFR